MTRYERQIAIREIGIAGQEALAKASVLIVGIGGLGCVSATYLTVAGVGRIGLADADIVAPNNLNRQICYNESDIGQLKVNCAANHLRRLNSGIVVEAMPLYLTESNAPTIIPNYDIIIDGTDNYESRFIISDCCALLHKPFVYGAVCEFSGQVGILCCGKRSYRDFMPDVEQIPRQAKDKNIIGPTAGVVGCMQASEVIKYITMRNTSLIDKLCIINLLTCQTDILSL